MRLNNVQISWFSPHKAQTEPFKSKGSLTNTERNAADTQAELCMFMHLIIQIPVDTVTAEENEDDANDISFA